MTSITREKPHTFPISPPGVGAPVLGVLHLSADNLFMSHWQSKCNLHVTHTAQAGHLGMLRRSINFSMARNDNKPTPAPECSIQFPVTVWADSTRNWPEKEIVFSLKLTDSNCIDGVANCVLTRDFRDDTDWGDVSASMPQSGRVFIGTVVACLVTHWRHALSPLVWRGRWACSDRGEGGFWPSQMTGWSLPPCNRKPGPSRS